MSAPKTRRPVARERALLVQVILGGFTRELAADSLQELERLADTAGAVVVGTLTQRRGRPHPGYYVGTGKIEEIKLACRHARANVVIFDNELSPIQVNNLDIALGTKVIDRTELILQIFARRAKSAESQYQVELAQLEYLISRIPHSEKQARFTGGIGMRGPGETPLSLRNEPMRRRMRDLRDRLAGIQQRREQSLLKRRWPIVSLVGYTNAGKSTLLNALTKADAYVDDRLFATLDTKTRLLYLAPGRQVLLTDTVGFIRHLPHGLVACFRSTLQVAVEADLLLVVLEADHPYVGDHLAVVRETLTEIGAERVPCLLLLNKCDLLEDPARLAELLDRFPEAIPVSAVAGTGLGTVRRRIADLVSSLWVRPLARPETTAVPAPPLPWQGQKGAH